MKKTQFEHLKKWGVACTLLCMFAIAFTSCKPLSTDNSTRAEASIYASWKSTWGEEYIISSTDFTSKYTDFTTKEIKLSYAGNNVLIVPTDKTSGYIYMKYTKNISKPSAVGKWYAVHYKDLNLNAVKLSGALKASVFSFDTLAEAQKTATVDNGFFAYYSTCSKK